MLDQLRAEIDGERFDRPRRVDLRGADAAVVEDQEAVVVDCERAAVEVAALLAAPRGADGKSVRAGTEFRVPCAAPDDAVLAAPPGVEAVPGLGMRRSEVGERS